MKKCYACLALFFMVMQLSMKSYCSDAPRASNQSDPCQKLIAVPLKPLDQSVLIPSASAENEPDDEGSPRYRVLQDSQQDLNDELQALCKRMEEIDNLTYTKRMCCGFCAGIVVFSCVLYSVIASYHA